MAAAVVQCAWIHAFPSANGRGVQCWKPRDARCRKASSSQARGVVASMAQGRGEDGVVEGCGTACNVLRFAQKTVVAVALGLSLSIGGARVATHLMAWDSLASCPCFWTLRKIFSIQNRKYAVKAIRSANNKWNEMEDSAFPCHCAEYVEASARIIGVDMAEAKRLEGVNKPELLPKEFSTVIDVAGFLSAGQEDRIKNAVATLEEDTGYKLRVLAQNYPTTPGLAVRDYWSVDDNTVVFVADPSLGNILNFNVGAGVDLSIPRSFWSRLAGKYGNKFYWQEMGEDASIEAAVTAIGECLREPAGPRACSDIK